jgi:hypothetical protein
MPVSAPISDARRRQAFADANTFDTFVRTSQNFTAQFAENYASTELDAADHAILLLIAEPIDVIAIVEDWCPDVVANLPILARIADDTGKIRLHVLVRDDASRDVADAYPYEGRSHIPTYVFSDRAGAELGVIVERTTPIRERVQVYLDGFFAAHTELDQATFPVGITDEVKAELLEGALRLRRDLRDLERSSFVLAIGEFAARSATSSTHDNFSPLATATAPVAV